MFNNLCVYGTCENTFGMFRCQCHDGYALDHSGGNCTDIDECKSPQSCLYGHCSNMEGSFRCLCPATHSLISDGNACIGNVIIQHNVSKIVTNFFADLRTDRCYLHVDDEGRCLDETSEYITRAACCCSVGKAWGKYCELCPTPHDPEYAKVCPSGPGYKPNEVTVSN